MTNATTGSASPWAQFAPDTETLSLIDREIDRQFSTLQLIASENITSPQVLAAAGSPLTNKYSEGYPKKRYYAGNEVIDEIEELARTRIKALLGAEYANVQPHSGANANTAAYLALLDPHDTVLGLRLDQGGHITHGLPVSLSGKFYNFIQYGLDPETELIDFDQVRDLAKKNKPKLIVAGATAYPRIIDAQPFRDIADEVGAKLMFDAAHVIGLIAGGAHPNPVGIADVVTFTTHKALRGPRGGCIVAREEFGPAIDKAVFPGSQGGPLDHIVAGKAVAFHEASQPAFKDYAAQIVKNAKALASALTGEGFRLCTGGTDNHLLLVDLRTFDENISGKVAQAACESAGLSMNKNTVPNDPRSPFVTSGFRVGTPAITTCGMKEPEMPMVASFIARAVRANDNEAELTNIRHEVATLCSKFPPYPAGLSDQIGKLYNLGR